MTRLFTSFDLDDILREDLEEKERLKKEADAAARKERIDVLRHEHEARGTEYVFEDDAEDTLIPVPAPLRELNLSQFSLDMNDHEFHLLGLPMGGMFENLAITDSRLCSGSRRRQDMWKVPNARREHEMNYDLPDGREFETIVEVVAAYRPKDPLQLRILTMLTAMVQKDLCSSRLTRTRVGIVDKGLDMISHDYGVKAYKLHDLKGPPRNIDIDSECDAVLGALLDTTAARYCAVRDALGVPRGVLYRKRSVPDHKEYPLVVGKDLSIDHDEEHAVRGIRRMAVAELRGRGA